MIRLAASLSFLFRGGRRGRSSGCDHEPAPSRLLRGRRAGDRCCAPGTRSSSRSRGLRTGSCRGAAAVPWGRCSVGARSIPSASDPSCSASMRRTRRGRALRRRARAARAGRRCRARPCRRTVVVATARCRHERQRSEDIPIVFWPHRSDAPCSRVSVSGVARRPAVRCR